MVNFARVRGIALTVTWYQNKNTLKVTWRSPDNKICKWIYYILVDEKHCRNVCDGRSMKGAEMGSGHCLVRENGVH